MESSGVYLTLALTLAEKVEVGGWRAGRRACGRGVLQRTGGAVL